MRSAAVLAFTLAGLVAAQNPTTTGLKPISYPDGQFPMSTPLGLPTSSLTPIYPTTPITDSVITITDGSSTYTVPVWHPTTQLPSSGSASTTASAPVRPSSSSKSSESSSESSTSSSSSSAAPQSTAAAYAVRPDVVQALVGGLAAGWAFV